MIGKTMQDAINEQINKEFYSSISIFQWRVFRRQEPDWLWTLDAPSGTEEHEHAMKFYNYILDAGGRVQLKGIDAPATDWKSNLEVAEQVAEHEAMVTASINNLYELALKEKDYPAQVMLQWFITEQVEEEKNAQELVASCE
jgi:ferritin